MSSGLGNQTGPGPSGVGKGRFAAVIPVYNHEQTVADVAPRTRDLGLPVIVVDDGSTDGSLAFLSNGRSCP